MSVWVPLPSPGHSPPGRQLLPTPGLCSDIMECVVRVFLETKEVNSVLCSKYKIDPACPPSDF